MSQDERETAIHEAAHAVVAHYYGAQVTVVRLGTDDDVADGVSQADLRGEAATRIGKLLITLAGAEAQIKLVPGALGRGRYHRDWAHDMHDARRYSEGIFVNRYGRRPDPFELEEIERQARRKIDQLLRDPALWAAICAVAEKLTTVKILDGDGFRAIVNPHLAQVGESIGMQATLDDDSERERR